MDAAQRKHLATDFRAFTQHYFAEHVTQFSNLNQSLMTLVEKRILSPQRPVLIAPIPRWPQDQTTLLMIAALWSLEYEHDRAVRVVCRDERAAELLKESICMELDFYNEVARKYLTLKPKSTSWGIVFDRELLLAITPASSLTSAADEARYTLILRDDGDAEEDE